MTVTRGRFIRTSRGSSALGRWFAELRQDLPYALSQLRRSPGFAVLAIATLAIGIGANVTMVGAIDQLLLRPPPGVDPSRPLARLLFSSTLSDGRATIGAFINYPSFLDLERDVGAFDGVAAFSSSLIPLGTGPDATEVRASLVSSSFFSLLGVTPTIGRFFTRADGYPTGESSGGPPLAVLGYGLWQRQFASDASVLGRAIHVGTLTYTVIGVAPKGFRGVENIAPDIWLPITVTAEAESPFITLADRGSAWLSVVARLRRGVSSTVAEQQATAAWRRQNTIAGSAESRSRIMTASIIRGRGPDAPREVKVALWLGGVSALVLLITCANVGNLLLARALTRRREFAVRLALGASRSRLMRQTLTEGLSMGVLGGGAALVVVAIGARIVSGLFASGIAAEGFVDVRLLAFSAAIALGTGVLLSLAPLAQVASSDLASALRGGGGAGGGRSARARAMLLGTQGALSLVLLVTAGLFADSLRRVQSLDLGANISHTLRAVFDFDGLSLPRPQVDATYDAIVRDVRDIPGVLDVALAAGDPFQGGRAVAAHTREHDYHFYSRGTMDPPMEGPVGSGFFHAVGATVRGRDFEDGDRTGAPRVAIVNEPLAKLLWPKQDALGQCVILPVRSTDAGGDCVTVVGVLSGVWYRDILKRERPIVYVPLGQRTSVLGLGRPHGLFVRVRVNPSSAVEPVRQAILHARPGMARPRVTSLRDVIDPELRPWRLAATMFSAFGLVALLIVTIGVYAVVSFAAQQRESEIAVRVALGARTRHVLGTVAGDGLRSLSVGLALGLISVLVAQRWIGPLLFQTSSMDPTIIASVTLLLLVVAAIAVAIPTLRSAGRSPAAVLRSE